MQQQQNTTEDELFDCDEETTYREMLREELAKNWANGFCRMPDAVRNDRTLSPKAKIAYEQLLAHMWFSTDRCYPSQQTLADETGYSRRTVIRACKELYERGYIEKWRRGQGKANYYFINPLAFPRSFRRTSHEQPETTILNVRAPERQEHCTSSPPCSLDEAFSECQDVASTSDDVSHPEVTNWHGNQTKGDQIHRKERASNDSTAPQKGTGFPVVPRATRNEKETIHTVKSQIELQAERDISEPLRGEASLHHNLSKPNIHSSNACEHTTAELAKEVSAAKAKQPHQAQAIAQATGIPQSHLEELGIAASPKRRPIPEFLKDIITRYSRELGDSSTSTKSNITRAAKLYYFAFDYIRDAQDDPQGFFCDLLYEAKQAAYRVNGIYYRSASNRPNRIPVFFACLENRFELSEDELAYIRSDEPLEER
jgi:biotin operon repressor